MGLRVGADIGGTFTDVVAVTEDGNVIATAKVRTTPRNPEIAVLEGLDRVLAASGERDADALIHATTLMTNAIVERRGARVGLLVTKGYRDTLEIARQHRFDMYDLRITRPGQLVGRGDRREIDERTLVDGSVEVPLHLDGVRQVMEELRAAGVEAVAIVYLHAYRNPLHELQSAEAVASAAPNLPISLSHIVSGQFREYERMVTTTANAYVQPIAARYLGAIAEGLGSRIPSASLQIMTSNGGIVGVAAAQELPVRLVESGPAAGAIAAANDCAALGLDGVLSFDMGGTTAKACLISRRGDERPWPMVHGEVEVAREYRFIRGSGLPLQVPSVELIEIGAGGGSIARVDGLGRMRVGPDSAGAVPGPACYPPPEGVPRESSDPTVTDADVVLGYIDPEGFLGGRLRLDRDAAGRALVDALGGDPIASAERIRDTVDEEMALAFRRHCAERGYDPASLPLYAFGGAGPVHACGVARRLGIGRICVPAAAGVGSAIGLVGAPPRVDLVRTLVCPVDDATPWDEIDREMEAMRARASSELSSLVPPDQIGWATAADLRFTGQAHQLTTAVPPAALDRGSPAVARSAALRTTFAGEYGRVYGRVPPRVGVEAMQWRLTATGPTPPIPRFSIAGGSGRERRRAAWFDGERRPARAIDRSSLAVGDTVDGPALIQEDATTTVVHPHWSASVLPSGHLELVLRR